MSSKYSIGRTTLGKMFKSNLLTNDVQLCAEGTDEENVYQDRPLMKSVHTSELLIAQMDIGLVFRGVFADALSPGTPKKVNSN